jgi:hypothetical protein
MRSSWSTLFARRLIASAALAALANAARPALAWDDPLDGLEDRLSYSTNDDLLRARLSGLVDLEEYKTGEPDPDLLVTDQGVPLFVPRISVFLDAQVGEHFYVFAQSRFDRGFDPGYEGEFGARLDEYLLRYSPSGSGVFNLQVGKFASLVGNWTPRHDSWSDPFITAPLPYDALTGVWDAVAARSVPELLQWAHVAPFPPALADTEKLLRLPIIWGPDYTAGAAVLGAIGRFDYAVEAKNASLSAHPDSWSPAQTRWHHPSFDGRIGVRPSVSWNFGVSASEGPYLRLSAAPSVPAGEAFDDYREIVLGQDASYAWHHFQAWAELYEARFEIPAVANADTASYYVEAKYTFLPQLSGAVRWNQQLYATLAVPGSLSPYGTLLPAGRQAWGRDLWRIDVAPEYRFTPHLQLKFQASLEEGIPTAQGGVVTTAAQLTLRW